MRRVFESPPPTRDFDKFRTPPRTSAASFAWRRRLEDSPRIRCGATIYLQSGAAMDGLRIEIAPEDFHGSEAHHYSGCGSISAAPNVPCPNCGRPLFPALNLNFEDPRLAHLGLWSGGYAHILVCQTCAHYMEPYFVHHQPALRVTGGRLDGGEVLVNIDLPYAARLVRLSDPSAISDYAPAHRVGGDPPKRCPSLGACPSCAASMSFFGVLAYDDVNAPLTEDGGRPVALIIGDCDFLAISACRKCSVLRSVWVY
jgi:hypothetical protein